MKVTPYQNKVAALTSCLELNDHFDVLRKILCSSKTIVMGPFEEGARIVVARGACSVIAGSKCEPVSSVSMTYVVFVPAGKKVYLEAAPEVEYFLITKLK